MGYRTIGDPMRVERPVHPSESLGHRARAGTRAIRGSRPDLVRASVHRRRTGSKGRGSPPRPSSARRDLAPAGHSPPAVVQSSPVDPLRIDDIESARRTTPEQRATQTLEMMRTGFRLKLAALRERHPGESEAQIEARFQRWLDGDDRA